MNDEQIEEYLLENLNRLMVGYFFTGDPVLVESSVINITKYRKSHPEHYQKAIVSIRETYGVK